VQKRIGENVAAYRKLRHLSVRGLSERVIELGCPIYPSAISKIEKGKRRVDADDLVALAVALHVTPNSLLLPRECHPGSTVEVAGQTVKPLEAWAWATGGGPIPASAPEVLPVITESLPDEVARFRDSSLGFALQRFHEDISRLIQMSPLVARMYHAEGEFRSRVSLVHNSLQRITSEIESVERKLGRVTPRGDGARTEA